YRKKLKIDVILYVSFISLIISLLMIFGSMIAMNFQVRFNMILFVTACLLMVGNFTISLVSITLYFKFLNRGISLIIANILMYLDFIIMQGGNRNWLIIDSKRLFNLSWSWIMYQLVLIIFLYLVVEWIISKKEIMR
ncbi:hypothetical protein BUZ84_14465, partial [Mammaliicoccus sciuri]